MNTRSSLSACPAAPCNSTLRKAALACSRITAIVLLAASVAVPMPGRAARPAEPRAAIAVANGDFSSTSNHGSIGGAAGGGSGSGAIGAGPWLGSYAGAAGIVIAPTLTIGGGNARISGLLGLNVGGILNNQGRFHQDTGVAWQPNRHYTLSVDVDAGTTLAPSVLTGGNIGIALATGSSEAARLASSTAGSSALTLVSGTNYRVTLDYDTGATVSGTVHVHLFAEPAGVLTADLLGNVAFDNVGLATRLLNPQPVSIIPANPGPYSAVVNGVVNPSIAVTVLDALGDPIPGVSVSFSAPASGASATVAPNPAVTDINGVAQVVTTANSIAGSYQVSASVGGIPTSLVFNLTNHAGAAAGIGPISGGGQSTAAGVGFTAPIGLQVLDAFGNPVAGVPVTFMPPSSGASSSFMPNPALTDANGMVSVTATANMIAGTYDVGVNIAGISPDSSFVLTNAPGPAAAIGNLGGSGQGAITNTPFAVPLALQVQDQYGNSVSGASVTFAAPVSGPSASVSPMVVASGPDGTVSTDATANGIAGTYSIAISIAGLGTVGSIELTNLLDPSIAPHGIGEPSQNAAIGTPFSCVLLVQVADGSGTPLQGLAVDFVAPSSGASATLMNGAASGTNLQITTDVDGFAWVEAAANGIEGSYVVGAQLRYSLAAPVEFRLRNLGVDDPVFAHGFDGGCISALGTLEVVPATP